MKQAEIHEASTQLPELIQRALNGEDVVIAQNGTPVVKLVPCDSELPREAEDKKLRREPGLWKGKIWIADDFDETPQEIIDLFEGSDDDILR